MEHVYFRGYRLEKHEKYDRRTKRNNLEYYEVS